MRGEHSQVEREMRVPRKARLAEEKSAGLSPPSLVELFVALGGENSLCAGLAARCGSRRWV
eukprot:426542-Pleurochrysis_carterae.AAC.1